MNFQDMKRKLTKENPLFKLMNKGLENYFSVKL